MRSDKAFLNSVWDKEVVKKNELDRKMKIIMKKYNIIDFTNDPEAKRLVKIIALCNGKSVRTNDGDTRCDYYLGYFKKAEDCDIFKAIVAKLFDRSVLRNPSMRIENKDIPIEEYPFFALTYA